MTDVKEIFLDDEKGLFVVEGKIVRGINEVIVPVRRPAAVRRGSKESIDEKIKGRAIAVKADYFVKGYGDSEFIPVQLYRKAVSQTEKGEQWVFYESVFRFPREPSSVKEGVLDEYCLSEIELCGNFYEPGYNKLVPVGIPFIAAIAGTRGITHKPLHGDYYKCAFRESEWIDFCKEIKDAGTRANKNTQFNRFVGNDFLASKLMSPYVMIQSYQELVNKSPQAEKLQGDRK